jgi:DNA-binding winged helix-turn-helix (wHTH) protein
VEKAAGTGQALRFGVFELDLAAGELRKGGLKVHLQDQPFQLLASLLERPGEVVTREELKERLWPSDTYVDFDRSLNTAASKLRDALGDSATSPRFIETLPRRGYRFLAPVEGVTGQFGGEPAEKSQPSLRLRGSQWLRPRAIAGGVALVCVIAAAILAVRPDAAVPPESLSLRFSLPVAGPMDWPAISPDGRRIAYVADDYLWIQELNQWEPHRVEQSAGAQKPFWSPAQPQMNSRKWLRVVGAQSRWAGLLAVSGAGPGALTEPWSLSPLARELRSTKSLPVEEIRNRICITRPRDFALRSFYPSRTAKECFSATRMIRTGWSWSIQIQENCGAWFRVPRRRARLVEFMPFRFL